MNADGRSGRSFVTRRYSQDGETSYSNGIWLYITNDGQYTVTISDKPAWRNAIGASSGVWPISVGGSGQSGVTQTSTVSSIVSAASGITFVSIYAYQWGPILQLHFVWKSSSAISVPADGNITNITIGTLKSGYRPKNQCYAFSNADGTCAECITNINQSGTLAVTGFKATGTARTIDANTAITQDAMYFLA